MWGFRGLGLGFKGLGFRGRGFKVFGLGRMSPHGCP